jgi:hypothetical protein
VVFFWFFAEFYRSIPRYRKQPGALYVPPPYKIIEVFFGSISSDAGHFSLDLRLFHHFSTTFYHFSHYFSHYFGVLFHTLLNFSNLKMFHTSYKAAKLYE